ncbi:MAG: flavin reductase family protein, partial [bacterium]
MKKLEMGKGGIICSAPAMPVLLVGVDVDGRPNFMTVAWSGVACAEPLMISVAIRHTRHTMKGIEQNKTFSANVPSIDLVKQTDFCGIASGSKVDKVAACGFKVFYGKQKGAPLIEQCPVNIECSVHEQLDLGTHVLVIGKVEQTHISDSCITDGKPDIDKINTFVYTSSLWKEYRTVGKPIAQ